MDQAPRFFSLDSFGEDAAMPVRPAAPAWRNAVRLDEVPAPGATESTPPPRKEVLSGGSREGVVLAVINNKGGVGKTTTVVNVAAALSVKAPVLLVDLDSQGSATCSLGRPVTGVPTLYEVLAGGLPAGQVVRSSDVPGLDYVAGGPALVRLQDHLVRDGVPYEALARVLAPLRRRYAFILLDCAPTFTSISHQALVAADGCIVPVTPHFLALEGMKNLLHTVGHAEQESVPLAPIWGIALTMVDGRYPSTRRNVADLRAAYGDLVFQAEIPFNIQLAEAPASGKPIFAYAARSGATRSYWALTKELARRVVRRQAPPAWG